MTTTTLPTATELKADHRAAIELALKLDAGMAMDFLRDHLAGEDMEARWLGWLRDEPEFGQYKFTAPVAAEYVPMPGDIVTGRGGLDVVVGGNQD